MGYVAVVLTSFLLGLFPTISKPVIASVSPIFYTSICSFAPFFIFTPLSLNSTRKGQSKQLTSSQKSKVFRVVLLSTFVGGILGPIFYFYGLQSTTAADASLLANAEMVFTIVIASIVFRERLNRTGFIAVILVSLGIIVVATNLQFSSSVLDFAAPGHLLILGSSLCWGSDNNIITYISERIDAARFIQYRSSIAGPTLFLISVLSASLPTSGSELLKILVIGLVIFGGSIYFNFLALRWLGAIRSTLIFPISSLFGLAAAYLILHETIGAYQIVSIGVIFAGIYLMTRTGSVRREYSYDLP